MGSNLRTRAINDVKKQNTKNWALKIELIDPDGNVYNTDNETGEQLKAIQILYDRSVENPDTGEIITVHEPIITIARASLSRIPSSGETWVIKFPLDPTDENTLEDYSFNPDRSIEEGNSLGFIRIYPFKLVQS